METDNKKWIDMKHDTAFSVYKSNSDLSEMRKAIINELTFYEDFIPLFFSYQGEAQSIKSMYKRLREIDNTRDRVIPCIDVNYGYHVYIDYYNGMQEFIENVFRTINSGDEASTTVISKQLETARNGDKLFIDSIFGGKNNEVRDEPLTSAVTNVEFLIDFLESLKMMKDRVNTVIDSAEKFRDNQIARDVLLLLLCSVSNYCSKTISTIVSTYRKIINTLNGTEDAEEVTEESVVFKLF